MYNPCNCYIASAKMLRRTTLILLVILVTALNVDASVTEKEVIYEMGPNGLVTRNGFRGPPPRRMNLIPMIGEVNPSPRLPPCEALGPGNHPVYGNCSQILVCQRENNRSQNFIRRIVECPRGQWFRPDLNDCGPQNVEECPYGRLVANSITLNPTRPKRSSGTPMNPCVQDGIFATAGCRGFYTCVSDTSRRGAFFFFSYVCANGFRFSNGTCQPQQQVRCSVPEEGTDCLRTCQRGDVRTCSYTFIIEEFATMSIYCKRCPFIPSDCDLPNCVPGGGVTKPIITINRQMPGPAIQVCKDDILEINVQNRLPADSTTIHWHGIHQRATPHMDGVPFITQCPILPGNSFRYRMTADVSGTHLYHSHVGHQESDGMFGPMIIREPRSEEFGIDKLYDMDLPEHRVLVWHWFSRPGETESIDTRLQSLRREGFGFLINGRGTVRRLYGLDGEIAPLPIENYFLRTGVRYRFRAIFNTALNCPIQLSIDSHVLDIIATDGRPIVHTNSRNNEHRVDSIFMSAGERVDFIPHPMAGVNPTNQSFFLRLRGLNDCDDRKNGVFQSAVLNYDSSNTSPAISPPLSYANAIRSGVGFNLQSNLISMNNYNIQARSLITTQDANTKLDARLGGNPARTLYVDIAFRFYTRSEDINITLPQLNDISWGAPSFPPLTQSEEVDNSTFCRPGEQRNCENNLCQCAQVLEMKRGELVEMVLVDGNGGIIGHPFHMHGYAFSVVAVQQEVNALTIQDVRTANEAGRIRKKFNGPLKDTVIVPGRGLVVIRFIADNPGYWFFHCHISEHAANGMALVLKVGEHAEMVKPPKNFPRCGNFF